MDDMMVECPCRRNLARSPMAWNHIIISGTSVANNCLQLPDMDTKYEIVLGCTGNFYKSYVLNFPLLCYSLPPCDSPDHRDLFAESKKYPFRSSDSSGLVLQNRNHFKGIVYETDLLLAHPLNIISIIRTFRGEMCPCLIALPLIALQYCNSCTLV